MKNSNFKAENFFKSQGYARNGLRLIFKNERNFKIHLSIAILVIIAGFVLKISYQDWIAVSLVISMVLISETMNSAVEAVCDTISQEYKVNIKYAKNVNGRQIGRASCRERV